MIGPDGEGLFGLLFQLLDIIGGLHGGDQRPPFAVFDVLVGNHGKGRRVMALVVGPPGRMENLVRQVRIQRTGDVGDTVGVSVDELDQPLNVAGSAGNVQAALGMAKIDLHVDDDQVDFLFVLCSWGQTALLGGRSDGGYVGVV
ncbi:MAG: hypothetical protein IPM39_21155 [Chloroflexi bacterium]|nr:hypothetical protein [Chloroflexota bacterium]